MAGAAARQTLSAIPAVDWEDTLGKTLAPLAGEAFPIATWDVTAVLRSCFVTTAKFIKTIKILTAETDEFVFRRLIHRGNAGDWWAAPSTCTPIQLLKFCMWLRSPDGAVYVNDQRRLRRFMKKAFPRQTVEDVCYVGALEAQLNQLLATQKACGVMVMREKEEREKDYAPATAYVPLEELQMGERCYQLYKDDCGRRGEATEELSDVLLQDVRAVYGNEAAAMHKTEFMRDERRREEVKMWLAKTINELERVGERRQANNLRFYLDTAGGEVRAAVVEERDTVRTRIRPVEEENIIPAPRRQRVEQGRDHHIQRLDLQGDLSEQN